MDDVRFGTCVYMSSGQHRKPGAFSLTSVHLRSEAEVTEADERGSAILEQLAATPGFISTALTTIGLFGHTITAWDDADAPRQMLAGGAHKDAMSRFFGSGFASGGWTSVWVPARINASWIRCPSCDAVSSYDHATDGRCRCGAPLPNRLPYW